MTQRRVLRRCRAAVALALALSCFPANSQTRKPAITEVKVAAYPLSSLRASGDVTGEAGWLTFSGGLELASGTSEFGAFSGLKMEPDGSGLTAVTDTGLWFRAKIKRGPRGEPLALENARMTPLLNEAGNPFDHKWDIDAEGLAQKGDGYVVAVERNNRLLAYNGDPFEAPVASAAVDTAIPRRLRRNRGLEAIAVAPQSGPLQGATLAMTEATLDGDGNILGFIVRDSATATFGIRKIGPFSVTDAGFLPDGNLLILERRFTLGEGPGARIRLISGSNIRAGAVVDGPVILSAGSGDQIDNMEGLGVWTNAAGQTMVSLISDDNHSKLQRTLYLEFQFRKVSD